MIVNTTEKDLSADYTDYADFSIENIMKFAFFQVVNLKDYPAWILLGMEDGSFN